MMKGSRDVREIKEVARAALDREAVGRFVALIENDHGYALYQAVSKAKEALSSADQATLSFHADEVDIEAEVTRADFVHWIAAELRARPGWIYPSLPDGPTSPARSSTCALRREPLSSFQSRRRGARSGLASCSGNTTLVTNARSLQPRRGRLQLTRAVNHTMAPVGSSR